MISHQGFDDIFQSGLTQIQWYGNLKIIDFKKEEEIEKWFSVISWTMSLLWHLIWVEPSFLDQHTLFYTATFPIPFHVHWYLYKNKNKIGAKPARWKKTFPCCVRVSAVENNGTALRRVRAATARPIFLCWIVARLKFPWKIKKIRFLMLCSHIT